MYRVLLGVVVAVPLACLAAQVRAQDADFYVNRAEDSFLKMDLKSSLADFNEAIRLAPSRADLYEMRAGVYDTLGDAQKAFADYAEAIRLAPDRSAAPYESRAGMYDRQRDYDKAIADYGQAIRLAATNHKLYSSRGFDYVRQRKYDEAIADFTKVMQLTPRDDFYSLNVRITRSSRAGVWILKGRYDQAIADYEEGMRDDPKEGDYYLELAWLQAACPDEKYRDGQKAYQNANRAYQLTEGKYWYYMEALAAAYAECGDFDHASEWETKAIDMAKGVTNGSVTPQEIKEANSRLKLYQEGKPCRLEPNKPRVPVVS